MDNINFDEWAEELRNSPLDLIELLQTHIQIVEENESLRKEVEK